MDLSLLFEVYHSYRLPIFTSNAVQDRFQRQRYPLTNPYPDRFPSLQLSDTNVMEYILAADGQGVNDKDEVWSELEFLITQGQLWDDEDDDENYCYRNCTALHYAAALNEVALCKLILDHPHFHEADSFASLAEGPFCFRDGWTALHVASAAGAREVCTLLLQHAKFTALQNQDSECRFDQISVAPTEKLIWIAGGLLCLYH